MKHKNETKPFQKPLEFYLYLGAQTRELLLSYADLAVPALADTHQQASHCF